MDRLLPSQKRAYIGIANKAVAKSNPTAFDCVVSDRGYVLTVRGLEARILSG